MRKPILMLYLVIVASLATALYASKTSMSLNLFSPIIGSHPKSVPDAITCPDGFILSPVLSCDTLVIVSNPTSNCTIVYMDYSIDGGPITVINPIGGIYPATLNLGILSIGNYNIVWSVRDNCIPPATATCSINVIILDTTPPTIVCPDDVSVGNLDDGRNTLVTVGQPTAADNCGVLSVINDYNMTDDASDEYPLGTTVVCWTVTDLSNNTASCCIDVIVFDNTPPELICPDTIKTQCLAPLPYQYFAQYMAAGGGATDDIMVDTSTFMFVEDSLYTGICPQKIKRRYKIADTAGNMDTCNQIIIIDDTIAPTASCNNLTIYVPQSGMITIPTANLNNNSTDNCTDSLTFSTNFPLVFGCNDAIAMIPINVILTVTDECGNSSTCTSIITVLDTIKPTIICPPLVTVNANNGLCAATNIILGTPTTNDNCGVSSVVATYNNANIQGTTQIPVGTNTIVWVVTDVKGNTATCAQTVTVIDNQNPTITCPANITVNTNPGVCFASNVTIPAATVTDNCGILSTINTFGGSPIISTTQFPTGNHIITYIVTDVNGLTASCTATITVIDNQNPTITCPANITIGNTGANCYATGVNLGTPMTNDNCGVASSIATLSGIAVNSTTQFPVGSNTVVWTVTDVNGRRATCTQTIVVQDRTNPTITCPPNVTINTNPNVCFASDVSLVVPTTGDNCGILSVVPRRNGNIVTNTTQFPIGTSTVIWTVTDVNNNTAMCSITITVIDNQAPSIICPLPTNVNTNLNACFATNVMIPNATTTDNCGVQGTSVTFGGSPITNTTQFPRGINTVTYTVTDINGLTATCTASIIVVDNQRPTITCPINITLNNDPGVCYRSNLVLGLPATSDNCEVATVTPRLGGSIVNNLTQFPVGVSTVIFTVADAQGNTATCTMTVTIIDNVNPTITCPAQQEVMLDNSCRLVMPNLTSSAIANDNCTGFVVTQSPVAGTILSSVDGMIHTITFTVTDASNNSTSCTTTVIAKDRLGPDIVCKNSEIISLSGLPELPASWFVISATDNCGGPVTYQARRMGNECSSNLPDDLGPYVNFCCEDVGKTVNIVIEVSDIRGNTTTCMIAIQVEDNLAPVISLSNQLPNITISCEYQFDITDLSIFGTYVLNGSTRNDIVLNDPGQTYYPPAGFVGLDGVYTENCPGATVTVTSRKNLTMCNVGTIYRDFVITDASGNSTTTTQTITVIDADPFTELDIEWPDANVDFPNCNNTNPPTSITGAPVLNDDRCSVVAATYQDQIFTNPNVCGFIKRTWTVLDWCQYVKNSGSNKGKWTFEQFINFTDKIAPIIGLKTCRDTTICTPQSACVATTTFTAAGTDNCLPSNVLWSYKIDINNNGGTPEFTGTGSTVTRTYVTGTHRLTWDAKDKCGNTSTCSMLFTIKDCKAPTLFIFNGLATNLTPPMAMSEIWASDYNNGSYDNCTPTGQLKYSFSPDVNDTKRIFTCADLGIKPLTVYMTDLAGNQTAVATFMNVQDQNGLCTGNKPVQINGYIYTEAKVTIPHTKVVLEGGEASNEFMTKEKGDYHFDNLPMYKDYQLQPIKDENPLDGVTTLDLVMIQRHILGVELLKSPYQVIAADINNSQSITAGDLSELRKLILGIQTKFSKNTSWRFVDAAFKFSDAKHPWPFSELISYQGLQNDMMTSDFIGIKVGDINGDAIEDFDNKIESRSIQNLKLYTEDVRVNPNLEVKIPIISQDLERIIALQGTLAISEHVQYIGIESASIAIRNDQVAYTTKEGKQYLTIAYDAAEPSKQSKKETLFYLIVKATKATRVSQMISWSSAVTPSMAFDDEYAKSSLTLEFRTAIDANPSVVLQNQPNPFSSETSIPLTLAEASAVTISIYDQEGAQIYRGVENFEAGSHSLKLSEKQLGNHYGVLFCKVKSRDVNEVIKILRLE